MHLQRQDADRIGVQAMDWCGDHLRLLDLRALPERVVWVHCHDADEVAEAIVDGVIQGAAAVGLAAAYGIALAAMHIGNSEDWTRALEDDFVVLGQARPSLAYLAWVLRLMHDRLWRPVASGQAMPGHLIEAAHQLRLSDLEANRAMAALAVKVIRRHDPQPQKFLTLGHTGALAGGGHGTALGALRTAHAQGLVEQVLVCEGRPGRTGELAMWELEQDHIDAALLADGAAGQLMRLANPGWVVVGAERIAANGDVINASGTYSLAVLAMHHGLRFMVVAPSAAIDLTLESAEELYDGEDSLETLEMLDVTPADLIDVIVTEKGVVERPQLQGMTELLNPRNLH
ncbi:MAG: S-methyl-5-thioribose-1-phosphate isomerase [Pseudomonas sp.]